MIREIVEHGPATGCPLDLNVGRDRIDDEVARLTELGATERYRVDGPGAFHTTMADPEGNEFCVQ